MALQLTRSEAVTLRALCAAEPTERLSVRELAARACLSRAAVERALLALAAVRPVPLVHHRPRVARSVTPSTLGRAVVEGREPHAVIVRRPPARPAARDDA